MKPRYIRYHPLDVSWLLHTWFFMRRRAVEWMTQVLPPTATVLEGVPRDEEDIAMVLASGKRLINGW